MNNPPSNRFNFAGRIPSRQGLILIVVLGMLTLFSMLAISFVVVSSQSRSASLALARSEYRGTPSPRLLDHALHQLLRGTTNPDSAMWKQSLLEDLYGSPAHGNGKDSPILTKVRSELYPPSVPARPLTPASNQRPMVLGGRFLRIPLESSGLAKEADVYVGRVVTFLSGPLVNQSFHVVRYIGEVTSTDLVQQAQQYSMVVDISEIDGRQVTSSAISRGMTSLSIEEWIRRLPNGVVSPSITPLAGVSLCHQAVDASQLSDGHMLLLNDVALNGHGSGLAYDGSIQNHTWAGNLPTQSPPPQKLQSLPVALQPNIRRMDKLIEPVGGADESYDAADMHNLFLAHRNSPASQPEDVIPSFHRAALVNYIAHWKDPASYTPSDLLATLDRIVAATMRPLSIQVTNVRSTRPPWPALPGDRTEYVINPGFTGSNAGDHAGNHARSSQLILDLQNDWSKNWPLVLPQYVAWLRWLTSGPWDVDNDGDALNDSIWLDLNLPLVSSADGKLLRVMASYYVEDLDGRLDLNAVGNNAQAQTDYAQPTPVNDSPFAVGANFFLPQGFGFGSAEASLRPLFRSESAYRDFLAARYQSNGVVETSPGRLGDDLASRMLDREREVVLPIALPALPLSLQGKAALGLDRLGNPLLIGDDPYGDDPYDSRWRRGAQSDWPFGISEWERIYRLNDWDRSKLPSRLAERLSSAARFAVTPRSAHLRTPVLSTRSIVAAEPVSSLFEFVNVVLKRRLLNGGGTVSSDPILPHAAFVELFPLEFQRGERLNLNRPLGNGRDDDNNGQIDEPSELATQPQRSYGVGTGSAGSQFGATNIVEDFLLGQRNFDPSNPPAQYQGVQSRQLLARHLYCLAQCLIPPDYKFPNLAVPATSELRARVLAQWAANVVDFRDADAAMTRFPYDAEPFADKGLPGSPRFSWEPTDGIVWGMEQPELLLTESLATHDVRIKRETGGREGYSQHRIPQGSLFLELYCPRTTVVGGDARLPGAPPSLYRMHAGRPKLDLSKLSPPDAGGVRFPIWRVYIGEARPADASDTPHHRYNDPSSKHLITYQFPSNPWTSGLMFDWKTTARAPEPSVEQSRLIVFTPGFVADNLNCPNVGTPAREHVFTNRDSDILLDGGQYLVVGPRETTYFGSRRSTANPPIHQPNTHRIQLARNWARIFLRDPSLSTPSVGYVAQRTTMKDAATMIAAADPPTAWPMGSAAWQTIGLNVSEPLPGPDYYSIPTSRLNSSNSKANSDPDGPTGALGYLAIPPDAYHDYSTGPRTRSLPPFDRAQSGTPLANWSRSTTTGSSDVGSAMMAGTQENWCTAYLQRLADPDLPYHAWFNPYMTVDWIPIDLTLFNGEDEPPNAAAASYKFASRQKTGTLLDPSTLGYPARGISSPLKTLFSYQTHDLRPTARQPGHDYFGAELFVDRLFPGTPPTGTVNRAVPQADGSDAVVTLGFLNYSFPLAGEFPSSSIYTGFHGSPAQVPAAPFWANRIFANPLELAWVPLSSPGQFMQEFSARDASNPYADVSDRSNGFSHLMNWFTHPVGAKEPASAAAMLEMVEVGATWSDTDSYLSPSTAAPIATPQSDVEQAGNLVLLPLRAPYNRVTSYVEPGRVNVNTWSDPAVWRGIMWNAITPALGDLRNSGPIPYANEVLLSRRGYIPQPSTLIPYANKYLHPEFPTEFAGAFKSSFEAGIVPTDSTGQPSFLPDRLDELSRENPAHATILRGTPVNANLNPLFSPAPNTGIPHPFTKFLPITRLSNLITTRSNVFAIRVTIGYFEHDLESGLGQEFGADVGKSRRHRAFYVVDRSIPVGFQVGQDLNTDRCILVRRIIE